MKQNELIKTTIPVLVFFVFMTIILTMPVAVKMGTHLPEGDPMLNSWIISWDLHKITTGLKGLWNTNIFYPNDNTLAYSEHHLGNAIIGLPVWLLTGNPIATYNFVFLLSFIISGFGMFLLARYFTGNVPAGIIAGVIYAFAPIKFDHFMHLHVISSQWLPFALLYLHKFLKTYRPKHLYLVALFFIIQFYCSMHVGLFLGVLLGIVFFCQVVRHGLLSRKRVLVASVICLTLCIIAILPITVPYLKLQRTTSYLDSIFAETIVFSPDLTGYLSVSRYNKLYASLLSVFWKPEGNLFVGLLPWLLAIVGFRGVFRFKAGKSRLIKWLNRLLLTGIPIYLLYLVINTVNYHKYSMYTNRYFAVGSALLLVFIIVLRLAGDRELLKNVREYMLTPAGKVQLFYLVIFIATFFLALGPYIHFNGTRLMAGPYFMLHKFVPGFNGLRTPGRITIVFLAGLAVLAGYGFKKVVSGVKGKRQVNLVFALTILLLAIEFYSAPLPFLEKLKAGKDIPPVYRWLAEQKDDPVIVEMPIYINWNRLLQECRYLHYSSYHFTKTVNGFSGFLPGGYYELESISGSFPSIESISYLRNSGVKYILYHSEKYDKPTWERLLAGMEQYSEYFKPAGVFDACYTWEIDYNKALPGHDRKTLYHDRKGWEVTVSCNNSVSRHALDGNPQSRWDTGKPQEKGEYYTIDFMKKEEISNIILSLGDYVSDYPREYVVELSNDGRKWHEGRIVNELLAMREFRIQLKGAKARYLRLRLTGNAEKHYWSINEINIY